MQDQDFNQSGDPVGPEGTHALQQARALLQQGRIDEARYGLEQFLNQEPQNAQALLIYATTFQREGNLDEASRYVEDAIAADPTNSFA